MTIYRPDAADVRAYRDKHGCGVVEARAALLREWRRAKITELWKGIMGANSLEALRDRTAEVLEFMLQVDEDDNQR